MNNIKNFIASAVISSAIYITGFGVWTLVYLAARDLNDKDNVEK